MIRVIDDSLQLDTLELKIDRNHQAVRMRFLHPGRPVITSALLDDFATAQDLVPTFCAQERQPLRYLVLSSTLPGVFCLGGDLRLFLELIRGGDQDALARYARACTTILYRNLSGADGNLCSISLVEGEALGGGFEAALAADVIIAEKRARFAFPETQFGLFPGMGAFSFLARRISPALAKRLITSGRIYTASELYDLGVVDLLAEDGRAEELLHHYIQKRQAREGGFNAMDQIMNQHNPVTREELERIVDLWVETAMTLTDKNLTMMNYLLKAQSKRWEQAGEKTATVTRLRA